MDKLKPEIGKDEVKSLVHQYYGLVVDEIQELNGYDDCNFYCCINDEQKGLIEMNFKVTNHKETAEENLLGSYAAEGQKWQKSEQKSNDEFNEFLSRARVAERSVFVCLRQWHQRTDTDPEHQRQLPGADRTEK